MEKVVGVVILVYLGMGLEAALACMPALSTKEVVTHSLPVNLVVQDDTIPPSDPAHYSTRTIALTYILTYRNNQRFGYHTSGLSSGLGLWKDFPCASDSGGWIISAISTGVSLSYNSSSLSWEFSCGGKIRLGNSPVYFSLAPVYLIQPKSESGSGGNSMLRISGSSFWKNLYLTAMFSLETAGFHCAFRARFAPDPATVQQETSHGPFHEVSQWKEPWFDAVAFLIGIKF